MQRRLAAILAADVAGFSRLMELDERGTYERLKGLRLRVIAPAIAEHAGRIVKLMGDGLLAEFASAVNAVECTIAIQRGMAASGAEQRGDRQIRVRIGINLGDVMVDGRDIYGDGVNIAARIEALAEPGGIAISEDVHRHVRNKVAISFQDLGERHLKNIAWPVRIYHAPASFFAPQTDEPLDSSAPEDRSVAPHPPTDRPSIVVLPFDDMSGDLEQSFFSDGISEDIITDLSKVSGLFVIARNSAFTYKGGALDLKQVCRELGVRFALEGSVRKAGNRVRITAQLIDGATGGHLWGERYDRELTDIFAVQDEVTREIVAALEVKLTPAERRRVAARGAQSIEVYEPLLLGRELVRLHSRDAVARAQFSFEWALELNPDFARAHAYLGFAHVVQSINGWVADPDEVLLRARQHTENAVRLDPADAHARFVLGVVRLWQKEVDAAIGDAAQAIALDPNFADGYTLLGQVLHYAGRSAESFAPYQQAARLDPHYPAVYLHFLAQSQFAVGQYEDAAATLRRRLLRQPESDISRILLAACYGHLGRVDEARVSFDEALKINPDYALEDRRKLLPYKNPADFERIVDGLRKAGLAA